MHLVIAIAGVAVFTAIVYSPVLNSQARCFDDSEYVFQNQLITHPGADSIWRFLFEVTEPSSVRGYYQPLAMISLMTDYAISNDKETLNQFHLTNLSLHILNVTCVIIFLYLLCGNIWVSAAAGLIFAVHPVTVESLAWISERKGLLACLFAMLSLIYYILSVKQNKKPFYYCSIGLFLSALMSKPTIVSLPILLLLLDFWPLKRLDKNAIMEKMPYFILSICFGIVTIVSQYSTFGVSPQSGGFYDRMLLIFHNTGFYLFKIFVPIKLCPNYIIPEPFAFSNTSIQFFGLVTIAILMIVLLSLYWSKVLFSGFAFFVIALLPTMTGLGFTDVVAADKFVYFPFSGLLIIIVFALDKYLNPKNPVKVTLLGLLLLVLISFESYATRNQLKHWKDTKTLYTYILTITPESGRVHNNLANIYKSQGQLEKAEIHYRKALEDRPDLSAICFNLADTLRLQGKHKLAVEYFRRTIQLRPAFAEAHYNLGLTYDAVGELNQAIIQYKKTAKLLPNSPMIQNTLGVAQARSGDLEQAINHFIKAVELAPDYEDARQNLARAKAELQKQTP